MFLLAALSLAAVSCVNFKQIKVNSMSVGSVSATGLKSVGGIVETNIRNGSREFTVSDIEGRLYKDGTLIGTIVADDVTIKGGTSYTYDIPVQVDVSNISILQIISLVTSKNFDDMTIDISAKLKPKGGSKTKINLKDIPVKDLVKWAKTYGV